MQPKGSRVRTRRERDSARPGRGRKAAGARPGLERKAAGSPHPRDRRAEPSPGQAETFNAGGADVPRNGERLFSHLDDVGGARMVDVSGKPVSVREAVASARVTLRRGVADELLAGRLPKGDALAVARIAGIQAAKRTSEWIPLCHPLPLEWVDVAIERAAPEELLIRCTARTSGRTGVEMEALVGVSAASLSIYDMVKSADKSITIGPIRLERKSGGRSGEYRRDA